jgi:hypothetical protein
MPSSAPAARVGLATLAVVAVAFPFAAACGKRPVPTPAPEVVGSASAATKPTKEECRALLDRVLATYHAKVFATPPACAKDAECTTVETNPCFGSCAYGAITTASLPVRDKASDELQPECGRFLGGDCLATLAMPVGSCRVPDAACREGRCARLPLDAHVRHP